MSIKKSLLSDLLQHLGFALLIGLAFVYREERLLADAGYYFFHLLNTEQFWVEHQRYILILGQLLPWLGLKLGYDLPALITWQAINLPVVFYLIFLLARYGLKEHLAGYFLILLQVIGIRHAFTVPIFELYYGLALFALLIPLLRSQKAFRPYLLTALLFVIFTAHPFAMLLALLVCILELWQRPKEKLSFYLLLTTPLILALAIKGLFPSDYETAKTEAMLNALVAGYYPWRYVANAWQFIWNHYWMVLIFLGLGIWRLYQSRAYYKIALVTLFFFLLLGLINLNYYGFEVSRYQEQVYFPLVFLGLYLFLYTLPMHLHLIKLGSLVIGGFLFVVSVVKITDHMAEYRARITELKQVMQAANLQAGKKAFVDQEKLKYPSNWSYPIESILLSSSDPAKTQTLCTEFDLQWENNRERLKPGQFLFRRYELLPVDSLNDRFFSLPISTYRAVTDPHARL